MFVFYLTCINQINQTMTPEKIAKSIFDEITSKIQNTWDDSGEIILNLVGCTKNEILFEIDLKCTADIRDYYEESTNYSERIASSIDCEFEYFRLSIEKPDIIAIEKELIKLIVKDLENQNL